MTRTLLMMVAFAFAQGSCKRDSNPAAATSDESTAERAPAGTALPGVQPYTAELHAKLAAEVAGFGADYVPRTKHRKADGAPIYTNRLVLETSPYLRQHAHNPVNWYAWGDEAFAEAKRLKRPVFMSIGYSTCHWCHVMEEESFESVEVARFLNENFIAIKVDREERPDVDSIYMTAVRILTRGGGGWPMSVWLVPETREPFYGGTYFPPESRRGRVGFLELLQQITKTWDEERGEMEQTARQIAQDVRNDMQARGQTGVSIDAVPVLHSAAARYKRIYDPTWGGHRTSRRGSKFPSSFPVRFLFRYYRRTGDKSYRDMAAYTLEKMAAGGMYDQAGGGFHRYSTDQKWLVPHFEKMLYDNALLVQSYLEGYQSTWDEDFSRVAREILRYVRRDMTAPNGAFYSATDADSPDGRGHRHEGLFFTWTARQVDELLGDQSPLVKDYYGVTDAGNFEGRTILWARVPLSDVAKKHGISAGEARKRIDAANQRMYEARKPRPPPLRDDKIITAWNAMMISAFARAELVLGANRDGGPAYVAQAVKAAEFLLANVRDGKRLLRTYKDGRAKLTGYLNDYAFTIAAFLDLFEVTSEQRWLDEAIALDGLAEKYYEDRRDGGFFATASDAEKLLTREKPDYDGAVPSGNSIMAMNLLRLFELTTKESYFSRCDKLLSAFSTTLQRSPTAMSEMLLALDYYTDTAKQIIVVTPTDDLSTASELLAPLHANFVPNRALIVTPQAGTASLAKRVPLVKDKIALRGKPTVYVCEHRRCELPTNDPKVFLSQLKKVAPLPPATP